MSKIANDGLAQSGTGCFIAVPTDRLLTVPDLYTYVDMIWYCAGGVSPRRQSVKESRRLHSQLSDQCAGVVLRTTTLPLQRGAVQTVWEPPLSGNVRRRHTGPGH